jgi:hypothetical protein
MLPMVRGGVQFKRMNCASQIFDFTLFINSYERVLFR